MTYSKEMILQQCNALCKNTLMETLDIQFIDFTEDSLTARMPVTSKVHQPDGVLHGGASVALAESVGSAAAIVFMDTEKAAQDDLAHRHHGHRRHRHRPRRARDVG